MSDSHVVENFGRNLAFRPSAVYTPADEAEVLEILERHRGEPIRAVGRLHSWSNAPVGEGVLLDLRRLDTVRVDVRGESVTAVVGAGCQVKRLVAELSRQGDWTTPSLGLIDEQTIAGATATGTHGSGKHSLSHYIEAVRIARYDAESDQAVIVEIEGNDELRAARCSLGSLGVIVSVRVAVRRAYRVEEHFRRYATLDAVLQKETEYPLQQFFLIPWDWRYFSQHRRETERPRSGLARLYRIYWWLVLDVSMHLTILFAVRLVRLYGYTRFLFRWVIPNGVIRNWKVVDRSERMLVMEHELFRHLEMELFVQRSDLPRAMEAVRELIEVAGGRRRDLSDAVRQSLSGAPNSGPLGAIFGRHCHHYPVCVRRILPDDTLISMASGAGEDWYSISLITYAHPASREGFFAFCRVLAEWLSAGCGARPHWGKWHPFSPEQMRDLYPEFDRFREICDSADADGRFRNRWTGALLEETADRTPRPVGGG